MYSKCQKCGRKLTDPESIERGYGPECWGSILPHYSIEQEGPEESLYNASGCKDRTAHDAICAADRTRTLVYRASRTKKDEEAELFVKMVKRLARGFGFKLCDRIKFEDPETGKKYV